VGSQEGGAVPDNRVILQALAEDNRATLMRLLVDSQQSVKDLVGLTGLSQPLVSHHLKVLREAGLVESTTCANRSFYRVRAATLSELADRLSLMAQRAAVTSAVKPC
jgi:ArsR family transcriptional regulator